MLRPMFGIGGSEILVILVVALLFLGPDKLPDAAKTISKGIRDLKKQSRALQDQIESDEQIGGAIRDLKSALRGEDFPNRPPVRREPPKLPPEATEAGVETADASLAAGPAAGLTLPETAGESDDPPWHDPNDPASYGGHPDYDEFGHLIKRPPGAVAKGEAIADAPASTDAPATSDDSDAKHKHG